MTFRCNIVCKDAGLMTSNDGLFEESEDITEIISLILIGSTRENMSKIHKFYGSSFRSHPRPAIFSCTIQFVLLLDIENVHVLRYYFHVLS